MNPSDNKKGFTLIELMLTMASSSILILLVGIILFMGYRSWRVNGHYVQLQRDTALAVRIMSEGVRESTTNEIIAVNGSLTLAPNEVRSAELKYMADGTGTLIRYVDGAENGLIILKGLESFTPELQEDGVLLQIVMQDDDPDADITMTTRTFINTRNRL